MAFEFDIDIYNWLLTEILQVEPTGDPVNDAVYLVLLPLVVLYMYSDYVITKSRFMGSYGRFKYIFMFVVGFFIIREGYYKIFASFSLPLLIIIVLLNTFSFIFGGGREAAEANEKYKVGYRSGGSGDGSGKRSFLSHVFHPFFKAYNSSTRELAYASWSKDDLEEEAERLVDKWQNLEADVKAKRSTSRSVFSVGGGSGGDSGCHEEYAEQESIEEELVPIVKVARSKGSGKIDSIITRDQQLARIINSRINRA